MAVPDEQRGRVLLVGDVGRAFFDADALAAGVCEVHANVLDAIDAAAKNRFAVVGVVMAGMSGRLSSALKALRDVCGGARIILLAQMYEEPAAIRLVGSNSNGSAVADDYLICPVDYSHLTLRLTYAEESVPRLGRDMPVKGRQAAGAATPAIVDAAVENKFRQLERLATEDDLTGLKNRRYIWEFGRQIIEYAKRQGARVTLLFFDIDDFKHYNDVYGHATADKILKQAAVLMQRCCRSYDVVGRIGGDEFAVVFWDDLRHKPAGGESERRSATADHPSEPIFIAKRFRRELERTELPLLGPRGSGVLTISGGLASFPRNGATIQELFLRADEALLDAKHSGKNRIYLVGKPQNDIDDIE